MATHARLWKRNGVYYHRAKVPSDIADRYNKREETFSLGTKDYHEAVKRLRIAASLVDERFEQARVKGFKHLTDLNFVVDVNNEVDMGRLKQEIKSFSEMIYEQVMVNHESYLATVDGEGQPATADSLPGHIGKAEMDLQRCINRIRYGGLADWVRVSLENYLVNAGWTANELGAMSARRVWHRFMNAIHQAEKQAYQEIYDRYNQPGPSELPVAVTAAPLPETLEDGPILSDVIQQYLKEKQRQWAPKTYKAIEKSLHAFVELVGDRAINQYSKKDARAFKEALLILPPHWKGNVKLKGLSIGDAVKETRILGLDPMSAKNATKQLQFVGSFWKWVCDHFDEIPYNIFQGMSIKVKSNPRDERYPFSHEQLDSYFSSPIYKGCKNLSHPHLEGDNIYKLSAIYWAVPVSLYSGLRLQELLQLELADIKNEAGIYYFDINDYGPDKRLKTHSSKRIIPIHSKLIEMGLLELVKHCKAKGFRRLFPDEKLGKDGTYSNKFSKKMNRYLTDIGVKTSKKICFHSTRHNFEDACREASVGYEVMNALQGHVITGMPARYGNGSTIKKLKKCIEKIRY